MGKIVRAVCGAIGYSVISTGLMWADTVPLALPAPLPNIAINLPALPDVVPVRLTVPALNSAADTANDLPEVTERQADVSAFGFPCDTTLNSKAAPNSMIVLLISAPCKPNQQVAVSFEGLTFDTNLSMIGDAKITLPAMAERTDLSVEFEDGAMLVTSAKTRGTAEFLRVALGWSDMGAPKLAGKAPRHLPVETSLLGDETGRIVQVLSHHKDPDAKAGVIRLKMTQAVTHQNCGTVQSGDVVQQIPGMPQLRYSLTLAAKGCELAGRNLELKNILQDLKLASN